MCAVSCKCCGTCRYVRGYTPRVHGISPRCTYAGADVRSERHDSGTGAHLFHGTEQNRAYQSSEYNILYGTEYVPMPNLDRRTICQTQYTKRMHATLVHRATCGAGSERAVPERERRETMWRARSEIECQINPRWVGHRIRLRQPRRHRPQKSHL